MADVCAYCRKEEQSWKSILCYKCDECGFYVHFDCIKSKQPSPLLGDSIFKFKCQSCGEDNKEEFHRDAVSWRRAVMLTLYNLHKTGQGKCGFFHWKAHICAFIDMHWLVLFGHQRKKTGLWMGTVAGTLSAGCPEIFGSGLTVVEQGYWRLVSVEPPTLMTSEKKFRPKTYRKRRSELPSVESGLKERSCRRAKANALSAAIQLKEKKESFLKSQKTAAKNAKGKKRKEDTESQIEIEPLEMEDSMSSSGSLFQEGELSMKESESAIMQGQESQSIDSSDISSPSSSSKAMNKNKETEGHSSKITFESLGLQLGKGEDSDDDDLDIDIDIESIAINSDHIIDIRSCSPEIKTLIPPEDIKWEQASIPEMESFQYDTESEGESETHIKEEVDETNENNDDDNNDGSETDSTEDGDEQRNDESIDSSYTSGGQATGLRENDGRAVRQKKKTGRPRKRRRIDDPPPVSVPERLQRISVFEENELLEKLNISAQNQTLTPELTLLRRKLICNKTNREFGLPVFDLDAQVEKVAKSHQPENAMKDSQSTFASQFPRLPARTAQSKETRDLDRFMMKDCGKRKETRTYTSFRQRLVGLKDHELKPVRSPYTTRVLVPFIWRNNNMSRLPLKLKLLQEIQAYPHRHDPSWTPPLSPSIDFCYVRLEHIASVNALAREFFWPGIDVSECLQYPDFSCVVLYRKIVIAFAFMVPDRGYNEAYISFIFTHPEWRGVGIASFMLYHLIQTCMGKDVLLHVSASNPAMLLYQKFGFKAEELSLNFYHKYFPSNCTDSCHAFLMRLSR